MSKAQQDQFIDDDEEEVCPLCVEELDLTDKGFRPCPCGYQICQFCYNNVKNNMNGLCPACRRPYDDKNIIYKPITAEEQAAYKTRQALKQKKTQAALQKEKQKAEADNLSRKHLAGLRVVQKNLVYVTGLSPNFQEDKLLQTLRGNEYFGQYGKIIKIVVSKAKDISHPQSVGVYVTYERKEDAATCITMVNGTQNGDRTLRAQYGTTKYCSAYLRGETCTNRQCMFLHEPGEAGESYSRADLSALNAGSSQQGSSIRPPPQSQQPVASASASQPMARHSSGDGLESPAVTRPALPSTASWAARPSQTVPARSESRSTSTTIESPALVHATPAQPAPDMRAEPAPSVMASETASQSTVKPERPRRPRELSPLAALLKDFNIDNLKFAFSVGTIPQADVAMIEHYPPLFDKNGGARRRQRRRREEEQSRMEETAQAFQQPLTIDTEDDLELSGSLQLGGEPEDRANLSQPQSAIQPPGSDGLLDQRFQFGGMQSPGVDGRGMTQQQLLLMKGQGAQSSYLNSNQSSSFQPPSHPPGHQRNASRYSFANESSASTSVKPVANAKLLNQQSSIMPPTGGNHFGAQQQPHGSQFYTSNVQGPPPGLKTTGTPPVSGGMTFGQGHGFATGGLAYGANAGGRNPNEEMMRNLLRTRGDDGSTKHDADFPPLGPPSRQQSISSLGRSTPPVPPGFEAHARNNSESRRSTPVAPPGLSKLAAPIGALQGLGMVGKDTTVPAAASTSIAARATSTAAPALAGRVSAVATPVGTPRLVPAVPAGLEGVGSRPSSRASLKRAGSYHITPAVPLRPATPIRTVTPTITPRVEGKARVQEVETPTKAPKTDAAKFRGSTKTAEDKAEDESAKAGAEKEVEVQPENAEDGDAVQKRSVEAAVSAMVAPKEVKVESTAPSSTAPKHSVVESAARATVAPQTKGEPAPPPVQKSAPKAMQLIAKGQATTQSSTAEAAPVTPSKAETTKNDQQQKRKQPPGKLDISAAVQPDIQAASSKQTAETPEQARAKDQPAAASPATSKVDTKAGSPSVASPAIKIAPKTLRVVATPKTETPPAGVTTPKDAVSAVPPVPAKAPSRKPSVASINLPGTPSSEQVSASDNISIPSASQSRANSPPPMAGSSKVGSAPVKAKTKNQLKKERRAKAIEEEKEKPEELTKAVPEEPAQEAIVSRKKKTKKEKEHKPPKPKASAAVDAAGTTKTGESTPTTSRPVTPQAATPPVPSKPEPALKDVKTSKPSTPTRAPIGQQPLPMFSPSELSPPPTPTLSAAQLIAELKATAPEIQKCIDSLFRSPASSTNYKPTQPITAKDLAAFKQDFKLDLTQSEVRALLSGSVPAVRYGGGDKGSTWDRGLVSPTGAHLRALTQELETRFLELEKAIHELPEELQFNPSKPQNNVKFPSVDLEALKRQFENIGGRNVSVMEQMVQDGSTMKKGAFLVDEASKYINEFVMPPATPPPSVGGGSVPATTPVQGKVAGEGEGMSVAALEQQLGKARKDAEDREGALRKVMKKNKKVLGLA